MRGGNGVQTIRAKITTQRNVDRIKTHRILAGSGTISITVFLARMKNVIHNKITSAEIFVSLQSSTLTTTIHIKSTSQVFVTSFRQTCHSIMEQTQLY